jgi:predicted GNAT family acetyltransferase
MENCKDSDMVTYQMKLEGVDWAEMKAALTADDFDNGRTPAELAESFANSYAAVVAYDGEKVIGTARVLSDGVCNAYIVDVWTLSAYRRRGIASKMMDLLLARCDGQHVYLFTDDMVPFYEKLGFTPQDVGMGKVVGKWLKRFEPR